MATIGGKDLILKVIGAVRWSCAEYEGNIHTNKLNDVLYLPESPFNIKCETSLDESMKHAEGTWVLTKNKYSIFN